ncbi:MAG: thymidine phosphorylase, partial [Mesorhizobium sp.]
EVRFGEPLALVHARSSADAEAAAATVLSAYTIGASKPAADKSVIRRILPRG